MTAHSCPNKPAKVPRHILVRPDAWGCLFPLVAVVSMMLVLVGPACQRRPAQSEWEATVRQALSEIERHGLPEFATWGRANIGIITYSQTLVPPGQLGFCWQFVDPSGHATYRICLGDKWLALGLNDRGLVLLS